MTIRIFVMWTKPPTARVCLREAQSNTNAHFFSFSLLDRSNVIPVLLGPKLNHVKVELGIF